MECEDVIKNRFSVRKFKDKMVSDELINKILDAGRIAPTAKNIQPIKIYVVKSKEGLEKIDSVTPCRYNAPVCIIVAGDKSEAFTKDNFSSYEIDASIVATHMMLEATNVGVDNIWIEWFDNKKLKEIFNFDKNMEPVMIMPIGYKTDDCMPSPMHNIRKSLSEIVEYR